MNITDTTPRTQRTIGGKTEKGESFSFDVQVPQPFTAGPHELTEGEASALNQIVAENLSNNLRARLGAGQTDADGKITGPHDAASAQALVDSYLADYNIGVRRAGSGERQVTDPVEREARKIAKAKAVALIKEQGGKASDFDMGPLVDRIFEMNKDVLMREGKKLVDAANKAQGGISLEGVELTPKAAKPTEPAAPAQPEVATA